MAAGQGFKTFTTGEVLTAGDVNGYLMQGINVFTNATARDAAITAPAEGQFAFTKDNNSLWYYDGAAWVASGATGDIEGVTATSPLTGGGTSGTVTVGIQDASTSQRGSVQLSDSTSTTSSVLAATPTAVKSAYDLAAAAIPKSTVTTNGDLIYGTGSSTVTRRAIGSTGQVLTVSGGVPTWATPATPSAALTLTTIASGSLTSGTSLTLSSLTQDFLQLQVTGFTFTGGDSQVGLFPNASTTAADYEFAVWDQVGGTTSSFYYVGSNPGFYLDNAAQTQSNANNGYVWTLQNCKQTGFTTITGQSYYVGSAGTRSCVIQGRFKTAAAITSLEFKTSNTRTFSAGSYSLIGG